MLIRVVNPNTSAGMTAAIGKAARSVAGPGVTVDAVTNGDGPASIESHYDEALSVPGVLTQVAVGERAGAAGHVIACFGDPGLDAARELAAAPVVGIAEAAMRTAAYLGRGFSVLTTLDRCRGQAWDLADRYGTRRHCLGVHGCGMAVLELDDAPDTVAALLDAGRAALDRDGSDVLVLGCAGMADVADALAAELGVPVVDGVRAAVLAVRSLAEMGLRTSTRGEYAPPPPKPYTGLVERFGP